MGSQGERSCARRLWQSQPLQRRPRVLHGLLRGQRRPVVVERALLQALNHGEGGAWPGAMVVGLELSDFGRSISGSFDSFLMV